MNKDYLEFMKYVDENSFIDKTMAIICQDIQKQQDIQLVNGILQVAMKVGYNFNEEKIKHWLEFCNKMNNIDKTDLISVAVSNKFAELNRRIKELEEENKKAKISNYLADYFFAEKENQQLKQQLAENGKEIEKLNACVDFYKSYYISFKGKVINELEKVKRYIDDKAYYVEEENFGIEINEYIDNQIEELTHHIEDKGE